MSTNENPVVVDLNASDWSYVDEGGANIVVKYVAQERKEFIGQILRLRKCWAPEFRGKHTHEKPEMSIIEINDYSKYILGPLIGEDFVISGTLIKIPREFVIKLNKLINPLRPKFRQNMIIDEHADIGLLFRDLTASPSHWTSVDSTIPKITVELKPKWGYLPDSHLLNDNNKAVKAKTCRFCMHQYLKLAKKERSELSGFCPISLYSNNQSKIENIVKKLFLTPQNNFKVYIDSKPLIVDGRVSLTQQQIYDKLNPIFKSKPIDAFSHVLGLILRKSNILASILELQLVDYLDVEAIHYFYQKILEKITIPEAVALFDRNWNSKDWLDVVPTVRDHKANLEMKQLDDYTYDEMVLHVRQFLIATTAKDCSVMITFQEIPHNLESSTDSLLLQEAGHVVLDENNHSYFQFDCSVIDTDPKYFINIPKYLNDDRKIVENFQKQCPEGKECS